MSVIEQTYDKSKYDSFKQMELLINDLAYLEGIYGAMLFRMDALLIHLKISVDCTQELIEMYYNYYNPSEFDYCHYGP